MKPTDRRCSGREKTISDYLGGGLAPRQRRELEEHLRDCPACREALERQKTTERIVREAVGTEESAERHWHLNRERIKGNILAEIAQTGRPPGILTRLRLRPIPALAAGLLLLAAAGVIARIAVFRPPGDGGESIPVARESGRDIETWDITSQLAMMGKDLSLFRGIQESFVQRVEWITIDGREVDFDLEVRETAPDPETRPRLLFLAFRIIRGDGDREEPVISEPRIVVREGAEFNRDFALPPEADSNYRLRIRPRMTAENRIDLTLDLVFHRPGPDGPEQARLSASSTVTPGEPTLLGSLLPGDDFYRVEVLGEIEPDHRRQPGELVL